MIWLGFAGFNRAKIGKKIKSLCELKGYTQGYVAEKTRATINYLSLVENGRRGVSSGFANSLSEVFDIPTCILFL